MDDTVEDVLIGVDGEVEDLVVSVDCEADDVLVGVVDVLFAAHALKTNMLKTNTTMRGPLKTRVILTMLLLFSLEFRSTKKLWSITGFAEVGKKIQKLQTLPSYKQENVRNKEEVTHQDKRGMLARQLEGEVIRTFQRKVGRISFYSSIFRVVSVRVSSS